MNPDKIMLSSEARANLRKTRKNLKLAADDLSIRLGKSQAWLGQIERGQLLTIKKEDLTNLIHIYTNVPKDRIHNILDTFTKNGILPTVIDEEHTNHEDEDLEIIKSYFSDYINRSTSSEDREFKKIYIRSMLRCMKDYPGSTSALFQNFTLLEDVLEGYKSLDTEQHLLRITSLSQKFESILKNELTNLES